MKKILLSFLFLFILVPQVRAEPASLSIDPVNVKAKEGSTFTVNINMYTGNESVASTDIMIDYDKFLLEPIPESVVSGDIFHRVEAKTIVPGKLYIYGIEEDTTKTQPAQGTVASISFKAIQSGNAKLNFDCTERDRNTSKIITSSDLHNIINCTATLTHTSNVEISEGSVLGTYSDAYSSLNSYTAILGVLVAVFSFVIFLKYQRLKRDLP